MAEIEEHQVEEVDNEQEFTLPKVCPDPEHDEPE